MKTLIPLFISILFISPCLAQQDLLPAYPREITYKEIAYFNGSPFTGVLVDEKTNTRLGEYKNGYKNGVFIENYTNGKKKSEGKYLNGAKDGRHTEWFENGNKKSECDYVNGQRDGICTEWSMTGQKETETKYKNGKIVPVTGKGTGGDSLFIDFSDADDFMVEGDPSEDEFITVDVNPVPIKKVDPIYPDEARKAGIEGRVFVKILIDKQGKVKKAANVTGPEIFHKATIEAAMQWVFKPALQRDKPIAVWVALPFQFKLR